MIMAQPPKGSELSLISDSDLPYEQQILRDPHSLNSWLRYIRHKQNKPITEQVFVYERACAQLGRSYKLWMMYLKLRMDHLNGINPAYHLKEFQKVNTCFDNALILLNKMPIIWIQYLKFLMLQPDITKTRRTFNEALRALPLTQHDRIWPLFLDFADSVGGLTAALIWKRYVKITPEESEKYLHQLIKMKFDDVAAQVYLDILNNPDFVSKEGRSHFDLWIEFSDLLVRNAKKIKNIPVEKIIRSGIEKYPDQKGRLFTRLATYYINKNDFEKSRDIFEEGLQTVLTVRDFTQIFDTYAEFEESVISNKMEEIQSKDPKDVSTDMNLDLDIRLSRFEQLMDRRLFLLNNVMLRQDPNNVVQWEKRAGLWGDNYEKVVKTYSDAVTTINPRKANGKLFELWINYAKFYEKHDDLSNARIIFDKATKVPFTSPSDLTELYIAWAEMELRHDDIDTATNVMEQATNGPKKSHIDYFDDSLPAQARLHKNMKLWSFYIDLVESVGTIEETKAVYDRVFELKIATALTVVNYANFLEENNYFEDSFKVYERGISLFSYPVAFEIWNIYLTKAVKRIKSLERLRDLFEQALEGCPNKYAKSIYLMYGQLEEDRGLIENAMNIYQKATEVLVDNSSDRYEMFKYYIGKVADNFGLPSTRPVFEKAIEVLPDKYAKEVCGQFADLEIQLGEIDRARFIFGHGSQFVDPRVDAGYWEKWNKFELQHGNEDTYKEMLRIKRSVLAKFNTDVNFIAAQAVARGKTSNGDGNDDEIDEDMDEEQSHQKSVEVLPGFVSSSAPTTKTSDIQPIQDEEMDGPSNPDAIDIDIDL